VSEVSRALIIKSSKPSPLISPVLMPSSGFKKVSH
jgi:hypothetical protein